MKKYIKLVLARIYDMSTEWLCAKSWDPKCLCHSCVAKKQSGNPWRWRRDIPKRVGVI